MHSVQSIQAIGINVTIATNSNTHPTKQVCHMWEKSALHKGLNAYRLVRGQTPEEVESKAAFQLAQGEERWQRKPRVEQTRDARSFHQYQTGLKVANGIPPRP